MLAGLRMWAAYMPAAYYVLGRLCAALCAEPLMH